ncbi:hypothetical protein HQ535_05820 [bacterium]|nr:hypothetical protein [bacterium]
MARVKELPDLVTEFTDLAKEYVRERTVEPAKKLGRLGGYGLAAAIMFVLAALFLGIAATRTLIRVLPDGAIWSGLGYFLGMLTLLAVTGFVGWRASK